MIRFQGFERRATISTLGIAQADLPGTLARFAQERRDALIAEGRASPVYETIVNGVIGAAETSVRLPGPIVYQFEYLAEVVTTGLALLRESAPVLSGRYRDSFFAMANGRAIADPADIPAGAEVILTNDQPYSRKIQVGAQRTRVPPHLFDRVQQALRRQYGDLLRIDLRFIPLQQGFVLRRTGLRRHANGTVKRRADVLAGDDLTYPALVINTKH
jgi:hypothetical protein